MSQQTHKAELSLARRLVRTVLAFYLGIAGFITLTQLSLEYRNEKTRLIEQVDHIAATFKPIVMQALWNLDVEQIDISLQAMLGTSSDILVVEIKNKDGGVEYQLKRQRKSNDSSFVDKLLEFKQFTSKADPLTESYSFSYQLIFLDEYSGAQNLGSLTFTTNSNVVFKRVAPLFYITLVSALIKTTILSLIFYLVLNRMVGRPMNILSRAMRSLDPKRDTIGGVTEQCEISQDLLQKNDEIGVALRTFQSMREAIENRDRAIGEYQAHLEEKIASRTKQVEDVFKAKSDFLANMSHEIRTPMNGVLGITKLLSETDLDTKQKRYLDIIENSGTTLLKTINAILDHLKIEAGKIVLDFKPFCLRDVVDNCTGLFTFQARSSGIALFSVVFSDCPAWVLGDSTRIQQVLNNLISNSFKFTSAGNISLSVSKLRDVDSQHVILRFLIEDSGIGIGANKINQLFLPFSQEDSSTTRNYGGTGLGLSISKQLTELMGGEIHVSSEKGVGSSFWVDLPLKVEVAPTDFSKKVDFIKHTLEGLHILFVGISESLSLQFVEILKGYSIIPVTVVNGSECLEYLEKAKLSQIHYDAIVMNGSLTDLDPMVLFEEILDNSNHSEIAFLMLDFKSKVVLSKSLKAKIIYLESPLASADLVAELLKIFSDDTSQLLSPDKKTQKTYNHIHVLVAEDNPVNQMVITGILGKLGVKVTMVENGQRAVEVCSPSAEIRFDLILMDCEMPVMDGWEATRAIRSINYKGSDSKPVLIFALSAHTKDKFLDEATHAGMDGYLFKPIDVSQLIGILESIA